MKKLIIIAAIICGFTAVAAAQPRAIGARFGWDFEASYQHTVHKADFVEATLGWYGYEAMNVSATYNFMCAQPNWTDRGEWGFYAGPGAAITTSFDDFAFSFVGQVGLEYTFWFPLQLSADLRPQIGFHAHDGHVSFFRAGLFGFTPTSSVRYRF